MNFFHILKRNPYHDKAGKFTFAANANFVSLWARDLKTFPKQDKRLYSENGELALSQRSDLYLRPQNSDTFIGETAIETISHYTSDLYSRVNSRMKGVRDEWTPSHLVEGSEAKLKYDQVTDERIKTIEEALNKTTLGTDVVLYRGLGSKSTLKVELNTRVAAGEDLRGSVFTVPHFVSTSARQQFAEGWADGMVITMRSKKEARGLYVDMISRNSGEGEVLLPGNSKFLVRGVRTVKDYYGTNITYVDTDLLT